MLDLIMGVLNIECKCLYDIFLTRCTNMMCMLTIT